MIETQHTRQAPTNDPAFVLLFQILREIILLPANSCNVQMECLILISMTQMRRKKLFFAFFRYLFLLWHGLIAIAFREQGRETVRDCS